MSLSQFRPADNRYYRVIFTSEESSQETQHRQMPFFIRNQKKDERLHIAKAPRREAEPGKKVIKKRWDPSLKQVAVEKALELGLTHATLYLQNKKPELYAKLTPSTLQYWVNQYQTNKYNKN